jgi:ABC-2 type transporter/Regulator of chromosome condensation (RCC1) repeat
MTVLPIVERELRVAARRSSTYWARLAIALLAILVGSVVLIVTLGLPATKSGRYIFEGLSGLLFLYCLGHGRRSTADCLSEEKREGTLGLLFLTDLKGADIVLGKLAATSVRGFYGLLAVFPVLAIPLLLGGITQGEFWRMVLVLIYTFLLSLAIGMFGSALSRDHRRAMAANLLLLVLLIGAPPAYANAIAYFFPNHPLVRELFLSCPVYTFYLAADTPYKLAPYHFWGSLGLLHSLTWALLAGASWRLPRAWQDRPAPVKAAAARSFWEMWTHGAAAKRETFRKRLLDLNAFYWLAARPRLKTLHVWTFLGFMVAWWIFGWAMGWHFWFDPSVAVLTPLLLNCTLKGWVTIEAGQHLAEARRAEAFELLLTTPLTPQEILHGQWLALRRQFFRPLLTVIGIELILMSRVSRLAGGSEAVATWLAGIIMLLADVIALSWVAMATALTARSHHHAILRTVTRVLILPWAFFGLVIVCRQLWHELVLGGNWSPSWQFQVGLWFALGLSADFIFGLSAWWQLRTRFRRLALGERDATPTRRWWWLRRRQVPVIKPAITPGRSDASIPVFTAKNEMAEESRLKSLTLATPAVSPVRRRFRLRYAALALVAAILLGLGYILTRARTVSPAPETVQLARSNGPVQILPSMNGVLLILPDGSLWRWGKPSAVRSWSTATAAPSGRASALEQLGTSSNWVQAASFYTRGAGIRSDGTLWEWDTPPSTGVPSIPEQVDARHDWADVSVASQHSVALRQDGTLWAWGSNSMSQLGNGPGPDQQHLVQVGTNSDWIAIACQWNSTLALRADRTLWVWGSIQLFGPGPLQNVPVPTQVCSDTNWAGLNAGLAGGMRMLSGEVWLTMPFLRAPNAEAPASLICRLLVSNAPKERIALAYVGRPRIYQVRKNGTLWEKDFDWALAAPSGAEVWRKVGQRSDWVALWGAGWSVFGLTSDGTLWTWGVDPTGNAVPDLSSRLKMAQQRLMARLGLAGSGGGPQPSMPAFQSQPRPWLRFVLTNSTP